MFDPLLFTANLRSARKRQGLSQKELAKKLFLSTQAVSKWERGESTPDLPHICRIAQILGVSVDWLLGLDAAAEKALIAVDGGGSKTEFVLLSTAGRVLKRLVLPGSNPNSCTVEGTYAILRQGIDALLQEGCRILAVFVGGAGMASGENGHLTETLLKKAYPGLPLQCRSDILNILAMAADPDNAIAVICGTGAVAYATKDGTLRRFGGGGWRLETAGSGYDLGREALLAALEHRDGTGRETALTAAVEARLGGRVWDHVDKLHQESNAFLAGFAPLVISAWQAGDPVASAIVDKNLTRIALLVSAAAKHSPQARQILLGGSLLTRSEPFRNALAERLPSDLAANRIEHPPIWGACLCCAKLAGLPAPDAQMFKDSYTKEI